MTDKHDKHVIEKIDLDYEQLPKDAVFLEYGDPSDALNALDLELRKQGIKLIDVDCGGSDYHILVRKI